MISYLIVTIIIIIIIIVCTEYYFRYYKIETIENIELNNNTTKSIINYPWDKIVKKKKNTDYYIKINNINNRVLSQWQEVINNIRYDNDKYVIIKTPTEEEALSILNLFISNINNEITIQDVIDNDLINLSKKKATSYKLVKKKIIDLIKDGLSKMNTEHSETTSYINKYFDTNVITDYRSSDNRESILSINRENLMNVHENVIDYNKNDMMNNVESNTNDTMFNNVEAKPRETMFNNVEAKPRETMFNNVEAKPRETMFNNVEAKPRETMFNNVEANTVDSDKQCKKTDIDIVIDDELFTEIETVKTSIIKPYGGSEYATILFK
jgi:hypothetical protein